MNGKTIQYTTVTIHCSCTASFAQGETFFFPFTHRGDRHANMWTIILIPVRFSPNGHVCRLGTASSHGHLVRIQYTTSLDMSIPHSHLVGLPSNLALVLPTSVDGCTVTNAGIHVRQGLRGLAN